MRLPTLLSEFEDRELEELSLRAKSCAIGCGTSNNNKQLGFEDWSVLDDMADRVFKAEISEHNRISLFFDFYENFPTYHVLTHFYHWYKSQECIAGQLSKLIGKRITGCLNGSDALADPMAYVLWVDFFEDQVTVDRMWQCLLDSCVTILGLKRLLDASGPVPFELKERLYLRLLPDEEYHTAILRSLYFSAQDVFGLLNKAKAVEILAKLKVDQNLPEFLELKKKLNY